MKKHYLFILALTLLSVSLFAQNRPIVVGKNYTGKNNVTLVGEVLNAVTLQFDMNELNLIEVETEHGKMYTMASGKAPLMMEVGNPELVYLPAAIILPETGSTELQITYGEYTEIENVDIAPSKGNLLRTINPATVSYQKGNVYEVDAFFPGIPAVADEPFIMRDVRGQSIFAYPVQYNPVTKTLRIYSEITVTAIFNNTPGVNEFTTHKRHTSVDPTFQNMYNSLFINHPSLTKNYPTEEEGELLIICHPAFVDAMKPYVNWKHTIGRETTIVTTQTTGTTVSDIKNYIKDYYNSPAHNLAYVLLVGDFAQIPAHVYMRAFPGNEPTVLTDNYYGQLTGSDAYMEVLIGRMSAETVGDVQTQVQRSIWYERDINTSDTWIPVAVGISANEGTGGHGDENDYIHINKIRDRLLEYGYNPVYQEYGQNCGVPETSAAQISQRFNDGVSMTNYCNHGIQTAWTLNMSNGVQYNTGHVDALTNTGKLPFIFSQACLTGKFNHSQTCFAEAWMRGTHNNQPTGAVATLMATTNLSWAPPMTAQDEFVNICLDLPSPYPSYPAPGTKRTFAGAAINATQKMLLRHGTSSDLIEVFDSWTVFGDPTLMIRTKIPQEIEISDISALILGESTSLLVACANANGAVAALTLKTENEGVIILGKAMVENGIAEIFINEPVTTPTPLDLTIIGKNLVTYQGVVVPKAGAQPYLYLQSHKLTEAPAFGKQVGIDFELKNLSAAPYNAQNVVVKVTTASSYITLPELPLELNTIAAGAVYNSENDLFITIAENVPNHELIIINLLISCQYEGKTYTWEAPVQLQPLAPTLNIKEVYIENMSGVRLNQFNASAVQNLVVVFENSGSLDLNNLNAAVSTSSEYMTMAANTALVETLEKGKSVLVKFLLNVGSAPVGAAASVVVRASSGAYMNSLIYTNSIGVAPAYYMGNETFSTTYANFYDTGGPNNNYSSSENLKITFLPVNAGKKLKINFSEFNVETSADNLLVYNGTAALNSALIATLTGSELPKDYTATNVDGALTFVFKSNASTQLAGWAAKIYETEAYHNVSFVITDENNQPVTDATITFDGYVLAKNQFKVNFVADGTYSYSVAKLGYPTVSGTVKVENSDKEVPVILSLSSIKNNSLCNFYAYPNPFGDIIHIEGDAAMVNKVLIDNFMGQRMATIDLQGKTSFTTAHIPAGIYFITFERDDHKRETMKMIKQ
ncbi:MAG: C25 family cysteine peptidase [Lentimicrobiaceae bacterium]|nr:C25 family cysteine peptidase [Lentimicrobiaceae bacterium]